MRAGVPPGVFDGFWFKFFIILFIGPIDLAEKYIFFKCIFSPFLFPLYVTFICMDAVDQFVYETKARLYYGHT